MQQRIIIIRDFLLKGIWSIRLSDQNRKKALFIKSLRILIVSIRSIWEDKIQLRAAALTLYMLLSIVPVLAMGFGIAKGFGYDKLLEENILEKATAMNDDMPGMSDIVTKLIAFADSMLARTQTGLLAGVGVVLLIWSIMKVMGNIEASLNDIWQVKKGRTFVRKFSDYLSMMLVSPILIIAASTANVYMASMLAKISKQVQIVSYITPLLYSVLNLAPYLLIYILFTLIYVIMPNTKVRFVPALIGGIIAGSFFQITQMAYLHFQIGVSSNNAIYGTFAALPLFILWLQISWLIVLFGAKVAYATQNIDMYEFETEAVHMSNYSRRIQALAITHRIIHNFEQGLKPLNAMELSKELHIPIRMIKTLLHDLVRCQILSEVLTHDPKVTAFQPAQHIDKFTVKYVMERVDRLGENYAAIDKSETTRKLVDIHNKFFNTLELHEDNMLLKDI
jgi:membrane protein